MSRRASPGDVDLFGYVREVLLPPLGVANHPFALNRPGAGGTADAAIKVTIERGPVLLLRLFGDRARAARNVSALRHLEARGLPAPRLRLADVNPLNPLIRSRRQPRWATAESWIEGTRAFESKDEAGAAMKVAALLARFHAVTRTRWGRVGSLPSMRAYAPSVMALVARMIRELELRGGLSVGEAREAEVRFGRWRSAVGKIGTFHLVLNDANRRNFILAEDGAPVAIDVRRISYEPNAEEIANALYHFCRHDEGLAARFLAAYLDAATPAARSGWERAGAFFTALNTLKRLHRRTGPGAAEEDDGAPAALPAGDPRLAAWRRSLLALPPPSAIWPEPGSAPPL